jgi:hypothetical protein
MTNDMVKDYLTAFLAINEAKAPAATPLSIFTTTKPKEQD